MLKAPWFILCVIAVGTHGLTADEKLKVYFREKCLARNNEVAFKKLDYDVSEFIVYSKRAFTLIPSDMKIFCSRERAQISARINEISNDLKPCLSQKEEFLAGFLNGSVNEFIHFLCHDDGKYAKRFYSSETNQCYDALMKRHDIFTCFDDIFPPSSSVVTKADICTNLKFTKKCFLRTLDESCPNSKEYRELNEKLYEYVSKPCSGCSSHYLNGFLLMSMVLSYLFSR